MRITLQKSTQGLKAILFACLCLLSLSAKAQSDSTEIENEEPQPATVQAPVNRELLTPLEQDEDDLIQIAPFVISSTTDSAKLANAEILQEIGRAHV